MKVPQSTFWKELQKKRMHPQKNKQEHLSPSFGHKLKQKQTCTSKTSFVS